MAKFKIGNNITFVDRKGWGAKDLPRLGHTVSRDVRTHVIIHHTVIIDDDATPNLWESETEVFGKMRQLQTVVAKKLGADVPYNFVVFLMNTDPATIYVCEGRGEDRSGAHTKGHNTKGIGISLEGNFEHHKVDVSPYLPLISQFMGWLRFDPTGPDYGPFKPMRNLGSLRPAGRKVFAHKDLRVGGTDCPGKFVIPLLDELDFIEPTKIDPSEGEEKPKPHEPIIETKPMEVIFTTLREGSSGSEVVILQKRLKEVGFDPGDVDGDFGPATEAAVIAFQDSEGLLDDGIAGPKTLTALKLAQDIPPSPIPDVTINKVSKMFPQTPVSNIKKHLPVVLKALKDADLADKQMILMALATIRAETEGFVPISEFRSKFNTSPGGHPFNPKLDKKVNNYEYTCILFIINSFHGNLLLF